MKDGQEIHFARDHEKPSQSINTRLVASALISGAQFANDKPFLDTVEDVNGEPKRTVTWLMDGGAEMHFSPEFLEERITFNEFKRRFLSLDWALANPNHPIAYMRGMSEMMNRLRDKISTMKPLALIRRGKSFALVPAGSDAARREKLLSHL